MFRNLAIPAILLAVFTSASAGLDVRAELKRAESGGKAAGLVLKNDIRFH